MISPSRVKGVWIDFWPEFSSFGNFFPEKELSNSRYEITDETRSTTFEDVDHSTTNELLQSHSLELTNDDFLQIENDREKDKGEELSIEPMEYTCTTQLTEFSRYIDNVIIIIQWSKYRQKYLSFGKNPEIPFTRFCVTTSFFETEEWRKAVDSCV